MSTRVFPVWALVVAFVVVPLTEIYVIIQVGRVVGPWWTLLLLVLSSMVGAWLIKREGLRAWQALRAAAQVGKVPTRELIDGGLILVGGTMMLVPGFVTDLVGLLLVLPLTRPLARGLLTTFMSTRIATLPVTTTRTQQRPGPMAGGPVVQGEVVD